MPPLHQRGAKKIRRGLTPLSYRRKLSMRSKSLEKYPANKNNQSYKGVSKQDFLS